MKFPILIVLSITILLVGIVLFKHMQQDDVIEHVENSYINSKGIVEYEYSKNPQYLAESVGLYMLYLKDTKEQNLFEKQVSQLHLNFQVEKENNLFIKWRLRENPTTNALVDDL